MDGNVPQTCVLCGQPPVTIGVYAPQTGTRVMVYGLCEAHDPPTDLITQLVEAVYDLLHARVHAPPS